MSEGFIIEPTPLKPGLTPALDAMPREGKAETRGEVTTVIDRASITPSARHTRAGPRNARAGLF